MRLEDLVKQPAELRDWLARIIVNDPQYVRGLGTGLRFFTAKELGEIEQRNQGQGLTFKQIQKVLAKKGIVVKPPTFKKYVGMKLVSGTVKIQRTEKGSVGFYPVDAVRQINLIKYLVESKRDFLECYVRALEATPCSALEIVRRSNPAALEIVENLWNPKAYDEVKSHLDDLARKKLIDSEDKEYALSKAREFENACIQVYQAWEALYTTLQSLTIPGRYNLDKLLEAY